MNDASSRVCNLRTRPRADRPAQDAAALFNPDTASPLDGGAEDSVYRSLGREHLQEAKQARPGCLGESLQEASRAHIHGSSVCPGHRSQHLPAEQVGPWRQDVCTT